MAVSSLFATVAWVAVLFAATAGLTVAAFFSFILPDYRGQTFYVAMVSCCVAELVLWGYLPYLLMARHTTARPSPATRIRIMTMIVIWTALIIVSGAVAANPSMADTLFSDKILLLQLIVTLAFFAGAFFLHRQDVAIQVRTAEPHRQRVQFQSYAGGIEQLLVTVRGLSRQRPAAAVELDHLAKRLDTLKSQLLSVSPQAQRDSDRLVEPVSAEDIQPRLRSLHEQVRLLAEAPEAGFAEQLARARESIDGAIAALRHREDALSF